MANVHSGFREIFFKRILCILLWHIGIQSFVLQLIASVELSADPLYWLVSWLQNLLKPKFFIITLFQFFLSMVSVITESTQYLKVEHYDNVSRFRYLCKKLSPNNFIWFFVYFLQGILSAIVFFIALKSYFVDSLAAAGGADADNGNQVTETIIILINNAIWINAMFFMYNFVYQRSFKYFSLVQRSRYIILPAIIVAARDAAVRSFYYCLLFVALYLVKGQSFCMFMCYILAVKCNLTYGIVFSPFVLYSLWLLNTFIIFNSLILKMLFDMYLTNKISFPVTADGYAKQSDAFTLKDALGTDNIPLVQYLGYYDLNVISQFDTARRKQVFALSYPGGHPYTWRDLSQEALKLITDTIANLEKIVSAKPAPAAETQKFPSTDKSYKMRYLSQSHFLDEKAALLQRKKESSLLWKCTNFVKSIRLVAYFAETMTEKQLESALQHYQALTLACYSLSNLAAASMTDDKYGVVQQDLSTIISAFLQLNVTLNKLAVVVNKKPNLPVSQIKKHLTSVVKSSLYKMSIHFGPYVKDLALSSEEEKLFNSFILYKS